jgi:type I restriction enzyme M protein
MTQLPLNGATLGFEEALWSMADQMRGHMDPAECKHVVVSLISLKYILDAFAEHRERLQAWTGDPEHGYHVRDERVRYQVREDRDEYLAENVSRVPPEAHRQRLQDNAKQPNIGD